MCYFATVGANASLRRLREHFDPEGELELELLPSPVTSCFPASDAVFLITRHGCSCDLLGRRESARAVAEAFERSLVRLARKLGSVRVVVRHQRESSPPATTFRLSIREFVQRRGRFAENVVVELGGNEESPSSACA